MANVHQMDGLREAIRERLIVMEISAREASRRAGYNPGFVGDFLEKRAKAPNPIALQKVADVLGIDNPFTFPSKRPSPETNRQPVSAQTSMVPLFSTTTPTSSQFMPVPENPAGFVPTIPALEHITGAYAFTIPNDSNEPRYLPGEIVYVSPVAMPRAGDFVFVRFADGRAGVSRLQEMADGRVTLRALKATRAQSFAVSDIVVMHRIVAAVG